MPHSLPLRVSFVAGPYIRPLRPVLTYPAWSGAPRVGFNKRQSFKKGLHGWTRGGHGQQLVKPLHPNPIHPASHTLYIQLYQCFGRGV
eukprot:scaffold80663_cov54-Phaeocystis_antarctica.AAC.2